MGLNVHVEKLIGILAIQMSLQDILFLIPGIHFRWDFFIEISTEINCFLIMWIFQITESEQHKDDVRNKVMAQRIKRLIQTGEFVPMKQENLEPVIHGEIFDITKKTYTVAT